MALSIGYKAQERIQLTNKPLAKRPLKKNHGDKLSALNEENGYNHKEKTQTLTNISRKPLCDVTNSKRKPLGDLTNSSKPVSAKEKKPLKNVSEKKLLAVDEEKTSSSWILEEGFLHNHHECVKTRERMTGMNYFMEVTENECSAAVVTPLAPPPAIGWLASMSPLKLVELDDEMISVPASPQSPKWDARLKCSSDELLNKTPCFELKKTPRRGG